MQKVFKGTREYPPYYGARMKPQQINLPEHMRAALKANGGSKWVRELIEKALDEMAAEEKSKPGGI